MKLENIIRKEIVNNKLEIGDTRNIIKIDLSYLFSLEKRIYEFIFNAKRYYIDDFERPFITNKFIDFYIDEDLQKTRILIVDDNKDFIEINRFISLHKMGNVILFSSKGIDYGLCNIGYTIIKEKKIEESSIPIINTYYTNICGLPNEDDGNHLLIKRDYKGNIIKIFNLIKSEEL